MCGPDGFDAPLRVSVNRSFLDVIPSAVRDLLVAPPQSPMLAHDSDFR